MIRQCHRIWFPRRRLPPPTRLFRPAGDHSESAPKDIHLNVDIEEGYKKSFISKIPKLLRSRDLDNALKSMYVFKDYLVPNWKRDAPFSRLIMQSYYFLIASKVG